MKFHIIICIPVVFSHSLEGSFKEEAIKAITISKSYLGTRDGKKQDYHWSFTIRPDNKHALHLSSSAARCRLHGKLTHEYLDFRLISEEAQKMVYGTLPQIPHEAHGSPNTFQISIYYENSDGMPEYKTFNDPVYWNSLVDKVEGKIILARNVSPAEQALFRREFQNIRLPTPDPKTTTDPTPDSKDPILEALFGKGKNRLLDGTRLDPRLPQNKTQSSLSKTPNISAENLEISKSVEKKVTSVKQVETAKKSRQNWLLWIVSGLVLVALGILVRSKMRKA